MIYHLFCIATNCYVAVHILAQIHDERRATGNYLFVAGMMLLIFLIVLDYMLLKTKQRKPRNTLRKPLPKFPPKPYNSFRS